jgi:RimJ/RimL family protein N-acetyltransferase
MTILATARLNLVPFANEHVESLNAMNADAEVMRYLTGRPETLEETRAFVQRVQRHWATFGHSWWSLIDRESGHLVGAAAVQHLRRERAPEPDPACPLEIGWRLRRDCWHRGFASEAARAIADFAFDTVQVDELYAVCHPDNAASAQVMKRLGMQDCGLQTWYGLNLATYCIKAQAWRVARMKPREPSIDQGN